MSRQSCSLCGKPFERTKGNVFYCSDWCRLIAKTVVRDGCWIWTATLDRTGYGTFYLGRNVGAHRAAYELGGGFIPDGMDLDHLCRVRSCVNPAHLEPVTRRINVLRGDAPTAIACREGRCKNGHPRTPENTYYSNGKARQCATCARASRAKREGRAA